MFFVKESLCTGFGPIGLFGKQQQTEAALDEVYNA